MCRPTAIHSQYYKLAMIADPLATLRRTPEFSEQQFENRYCFAVLLVRGLRKKLIMSLCIVFNFEQIKCI